jgi:hypothetical protein
MPGQSFRCYALVWYVGLAILLGVMPEMGSLSSPPSPAVSPAERRTAAELATLTLTRTSRLTSAYPGFGGERSLEGAAWRVIVVRPDAKSFFMSLTQQANPVGRLYGLIGLQQVDPKLFRTEVERFADWTDPIEVQQGGVIKTQRFKEVVADIREGLWLRDMFLTKGLH